MNKAIILGMCMMILSVSMVSAQSADVLEKPGILPTQEFLWSLDKFLDLMGQNQPFTLDCDEGLLCVFATHEIKAKRALRIAEERAAEVDALEGSKGFDNSRLNDEFVATKMERANRERENWLHEARKRALRTNDISETERIENLVDQATARHTRVLQAILARAPDAAKPGLTNAIERSNLMKNDTATNLDILREVRQKIIDGEAVNMTEISIKHPRHDVVVLKRYDEVRASGS